MSLVKKTPADYDAAIQQLSLTGTDFNVIEAEWISGSQVSARRPCWSDIGDAVTRLSKFEGKTASAIRIYGDCIDSISEAPKISLTTETHIVLTARLWFPSATKPLEVKLAINSSIAFRTSSLPSDFVVIVNGAKQTLKPKPDSWGVILSVDEDGIKAYEAERPADELDTLDYWAELTPDGKSVETLGRRNDNLPRLLQYQFILASTWIQTDIPTTYSILSFIAGATQGNAAALELNLQANALAARLSTMGDGFSVYVPSLDLGACKSVLKARLAAVLAFENSYHRFVSESVRKEDAKTAAEIALGHSGDVESQYLFLEGLAKKRYKDAEEAYETSKKRFNKLQSELDSLAKAFNVGVEKWKQSEKNKLIGEAIMSLVTVTASLVVAVVVPPAGAAGAAAGAGAAANAIKNIAEGTSKFQKLIQGIKKIAELIEKLHEALEKIKTIVDSTAAIVKALSSKAETGPKIPEVPSSKTDDVINVAAEWDSYAVDVKMVFDPMAENDIEGYVEYYSALQKLPILGKAILAAQTAYITTGDTLTRVVLQQRVANRHTGRLRSAIANIAVDEHVLSIVRRAMFERLLSARTWVAVDFHGYLAAYTYFSLNRTPPIKIAATKPAPYYVDDAARLQGAVASVRADLRSQERTFAFTEESYGADWKNRLKGDRAISFTVDITNKMFSRFARIRVSRVRCYLTGATTTGGSTIDLEISTASRFRDIDIAPPYEAIEFVGETTPRCFEYEANGERIVTDGVYIDADQYSRPALFTTWNVNVLDDAVNLEGVTGVRFEVACEVSRR
ncbi:hypothetical protein DFP73DRAFT_569930 [Morchella snyderi]|nr:hypothetical protein DFP73DRAFT_569930 [Morchella snyderi]